VIGVFGLVFGVYLLGRCRKEIRDTNPRVPDLSYNGIHEIPQLETKEARGIGKARFAGYESQ
jgi:hypothetical protein